MSDDKGKNTAVFGNYEISGTIGQGGMGVVYRATDKALGRTLALKVLKEDLRAHRQVVARFQREAEAFATLDHPHIVHIYSVGSVGRIPYIAMEFIDGEPLSSRMRRERRIEWKSALEIGEQVATALSCAHESGIIHRDIKPGNVLIDKRNHSYVTDFGIAKVLTAETQLTVEGSRLGTPQYMSPERCQNRPVVPQSDLYSLGVLLFQMITGRMPFEASSPIDLVREIITDPPKRMREFLPDLPEDVDRLVAFLLEKKPEDRPVSGDEWARLSERVREGLPLEDESSLSSSLRSFRDGMSTPTTGMSGTDSGFSTTGFGGSTTGYGAMIPWRSWSGRARYWTGVGTGMMLAFLLSVLIMRPDRDVVSDALLYQLNRPISTWAFGISPVQFSEGAGGTDYLNFPGADGGVSECVWRGSDLFVAYETEGGLEAIGQFQLNTGNADWVTLPTKNDPTISRTVFLGLNKGRLLLARGNEALELYAVGQTVGSRWQEKRLRGLWQQIPRSADFRFARGTDGAECIAWSTSEGWWMSALYPRDNRGYQVSERITELQWLAVDGPAQVIFAAGPTASGATEVWRWDDSATNGRLLTSGRYAANTGAYSARHDALILAQQGSDGDSRVETIDASTGDRLTTLGFGSAAMWHPGGNGVLLFADDINEKMQAWAVQNESPHARLQLTFEAEGVEARAWVSPDGNRLAVAAAVDETDLLLIDVGLETLADQGLIIQPHTNEPI